MPSESSIITQPSSLSSTSTPQPTTAIPITQPPRFNNFNFTNTKMQFTLLAFAAAAVASPMAFDGAGLEARTGGGGGSVCPSGYFPQCCATNVLGLAGLACRNVPNMPTSNQDFSWQCSQTGSTANCCLIPAAGQGVVCNQL
ncbi:hypothetical protein BST61_g6819 [Cercospora zeina]